MDELHLLNVDDSGATFDLSPINVGRPGARNGAAAAAAESKQ
jgi:hypothetical protein